ncbi:MAG: NADH-ubiquinone oxidoreductase-F iron-sulfur binding region domain-containing protein [Candidatus Nanopelagicales bacterium]
MSRLEHLEELVEDSHQARRRHRCLCLSELVDANLLYVYVSDDDAAESMAAAMAELDDLVAWTAPRPHLVRVDPGYVAGEETAVVRGIDGFAPKPTLKPPRPYEVGVAGRPTLVANVESLARLALASHPDVGAQAGASVLATVVDNDGAGLYEVAATSTIGNLLAQHRAPGAPEPLAVLVGGYAGGIWPASILATTLDRQRLREQGITLGCVSFVVVDAGDCVVAAAYDVCSYLAGSSSGQCGICVRGTAVVAANLTDLAHGTATPELLAQLRKRVAMMRGRGNCAMPDAVEVMVRTLLDNFPDEVAAHLTDPCPVCLGQVPDKPRTTTRFQVRLPRSPIWPRPLTMAGPSKV